MSRTLVQQYRLAARQIHAKRYAVTCHALKTVKAKRLFEIFKPEGYCDTAISWWGGKHYEWKPNREARVIALLLAAEMIRTGDL